MSTEPKDSSEGMIKLEEMTRLVRSPEWRHYIDFLSLRVEHFQGLVNTEVYSGNIVQAQINYALMKDAMKQVELFNLRIKEVEKSLNKEGK